MTKMKMLKFVAPEITYAYKDEAIAMHARAPEHPNRARSMLTTYSLALASYVVETSSN